MDCETTEAPAIREPTPSEIKTLQLNRPARPHFDSSGVARMFNQLGPSSLDQFTYAIGLATPASVGEIVDWR